MASSYYKLDISSRNQTGAKESRIARKKGFIPGVLYYSGEEAISISIEKSILLRAMNSGQRIFEIDQDGESQYTMLKQVQYHPVTDEVIHVDLMRVRRAEKMTISVPIVLVGEAVGVKEGGVLSQTLTQVEISCYPTDVPEQIDLKIDDLEINASLSVSDIETGSEDIDLVSDASLKIVSIATPVSEEVADEEVEKDEDLEGKARSDEKSDESSKESSDENTEN